MTDDTSVPDKGAESVLKRDVLGRVKTTPGQRAAVLDEFERSGLSGPKFAAVAGVGGRHAGVLGVVQIGVMVQMGSWCKWGHGANGVSKWGQPCNCAIP